MSLKTTGHADTVFQLESSAFPTTGPRAGRLSLPKGEVLTPVFMPVGTQATVKGTMPGELRDVVRAPIILGNTYHLNLRPGVDVVRQAGGLSDFMNWGGPVLTDSGGFQVFSLSKLRKINDEGVSFRSHLDGREIFLGPKEAVEIQDGLRSDIAMCLDVCPAANDKREDVKVQSVAQLCGQENAKKHGLKAADHPKAEIYLGLFKGGVLRICAENQPRN